MYSLINSLMRLDVHVSSGHLRKRFADIVGKKVSGIIPPVDFSIW